MIKLKNNSRRILNTPLVKSRGGFAMVLALVVMTIMFVVVGSLSTSRQMWGFFSTKQLDKSNIEFPAKADSENWFRLTRESLLINGEVTLTQHLREAPSAGPISVQDGGAASTVIYFHQNGEQPFPALIEDANGIDDYPTYGGNNVSFSVPFTYNLGTNALTTARSGAFDPYWGMRRYGGSYAVLFKREMPESIRQIRADRFSTATQLRAWMSIDAGLITRLRYRIMPMSAFTLYVTGTSAAPITARITTNFVSPLNLPYDYSGDGDSQGRYQVNSVGMGRIYVDGRLNFATSGTTNSPVIGFPIVATHGFTNLGTSTFHIPAAYGTAGNSPTTIVTNLNQTNYWTHRYAELKGMLLTSSEAPQKLITRFANNAAPFQSKNFTNGILSAYSSAQLTAVRVRLDTDSTNNPLQFVSADPLRFNSSQSSLLLSTNTPGMWSVDHASREVTLRPSANYFTNFTLPPSSIYFEFTGANAGLYKLRVDVPSLAALGTTDAQRRLSVVTPSTMVISQSGFNADNSGNGAMLLSPRIEIDTTNASLNIGAYVVTRGNALSTLTPRPLFTFNPTNTPTTFVPTITGGLSYTATTGGNILGSLNVRVLPSIGYLQGTTVPDAVPTVFDYRIARQDLEVYSMDAVPNP